MRFYVKSNPTEEILDCTDENLTIIRSNQIVDMIKNSVDGNSKISFVKHKGPKFDT